MADKQQELIDKPLHANAVALARESVDDYAASVIVLAKTLAYQRGDDEVRVHTFMKLWRSSKVEEDEGGGKISYLRLVARFLAPSYRVLSLNFQPVTANCS